MRDDVQSHGYYNWQVDSNQLKTLYKYVYWEKVCICVFCWLSYLIHQAFVAYVIWYSENMEENTAQFFQRLKLSKIMQFGADADIYMDKNWCL